jgi:hypothetical protein
MPAEFTVYFKISDSIKPPTILYESPDKSYSVFKRITPVYNSDSLETAKKIGIRTLIYTSIINDYDDDTKDDNITAVTSYYKFNEFAGVPYGDENILVVNSTRFNDFINRKLKDGIFRPIVNPSQSTGEYANQVGYAKVTRDSSKVFESFEFKFPLPILTYTNAFNSLPQPSVAPLPA